MQRPRVEEDAGDAAPLRVGDRVRIVPARCSYVAHLARTMAFVDETGTIDFAATIGAGPQHAMHQRR